MKKKFGFTLLELIAVTFIVFLLASISYNRFNTERKDSKDKARQIAVEQIYTTLREARRFSGTLTYSLMIAHSGRQPVFTSADELKAYILDAGIKIPRLNDRTCFVVFDIARDASSAKYNQFMVYTTTEDGTDLIYKASGLEDVIATGRVNKSDLINYIGPYQDGCPSAPDALDTYTQLGGSNATIIVPL